MKDSFLNNGDSKNVAIKQKILSLCINEGTYSIAELSKEYALHQCQLGFRYGNDS